MSKMLLSEENNYIQVFALTMCFLSVDAYINNQYVIFVVISCWINVFLLVYLIMISNVTLFLILINY